MQARPRPEAVPALRELVVPAAVAAVGAAVLAAQGLLLPVNMYDAGISASAGMFILHGLVPYRDFWMLYGPLGGYLAALVGIVVTPSVMAVQIVGLLLVAAEAAASVILLRLLRVSPRAALLIAIVSAAACSRLLGLEIWAWQCAVITALVALSVATAATTRRSRVIAGAVVGLSVLFRQDVGLYALVAVLIELRSPRPLLGFGLVVSPVVLILLAVVPLDALYQQLVWYPIVGTRVYRAVPDPLSTTSGPMAVPLMLLFVWGARACIVAGAIRARATRDGSGVGLLVFALLCQLQALGRGDLYHFAQAAGPGFLCLATVFTPGAVARRWGAGAPTGVVAVLAVVAVVARITSPLAPPASYQASIGKAVEYVHEHTSSTEPIFVGLTSNRYTFDNPLLIYYLADRPPGVRDTMYNPGVTNEDSTQVEMVADLNRTGTRYLVLDRVFASVCEPFNASCQPGSDRLDEFIGSEFRTAADFGDILVLVRR